jgi:hypothetical protein
MSLLRNALILAALTTASPAPAAAALTLGDALLSSPVAVVDSFASATASETYFDADALLTLGALAVAGGALAAAAWRPRRSGKVEPRRTLSAPKHAMQPRDAA